MANNDSSLGYSALIKGENLSDFDHSFNNLNEEKFEIYHRK